MWQGYGPLQGYLVGYGTSVVTTWVKVSGTSLSLNLDPKVAHVFLVRAVNGPRLGALSKVIKMERAGIPGTKELAPQVAVDEANGIVSVKFSGPVGSTARASTNMVLTTTATLKSGWGYGIWARANVGTGASVTGYSVQYDPGYGRVSSFGKAILLRQWSQGRECGTHLAIAHFPAGLPENAAHRVTVVVKGDTLYLSVDGNVVFDVPSLAAAMKASNCGMAAPTGTEIRIPHLGRGHLGHLQRDNTVPIAGTS